MEAPRVIPNVAFATTNKYTCSDPVSKQSLVLSRNTTSSKLVIASCSPRMRTTDLRKRCWPKGRYQITYMPRSQISANNVHGFTRAKESTLRLLILLRWPWRKLIPTKTSTRKQSPVNRKVLVVGAGIAGIQAALDVADAGFPVTLVEQKSFHWRQNGQIG